MNDMRSSLKVIAGPALLLGVLTLVALVSRPLMPIDETRYVSVAWEMWLRGEYLVLFKNGELYSHKPPLLFWLYNLGWGVFGVSELWPRLVSPLFSLGSLFLTWSIAKQLWPNAFETHRNALWALSASLLWLVFSTAAMFDVMLAFFVLVGVHGLLIAARESMGRGFFWLGLAIGFGVLAKGPVVLLHLLPLAVLAPWWHSGLNWKKWYLLTILALLGGAALALAWAIPAAIHGGAEYRNAIFWGQTANRMVNSFAHKEPFWWYLSVLPFIFFPWSLWIGVWGRLIHLKRAVTDVGLRFCVAWMLPVFVAFSFVSGKQEHYLMPIFPAFALFAGHVTASAKIRGAFLPIFATALVAVAMLYFSFAGLPEHLRLYWGLLPWWPAALLAAIAVVAFSQLRSEKWRVPALAVMGATLVASIQFYLSPGLMRGYDMHPIGQNIRQLQSQGVPVAHLGRYHAQFQFAGRLEHPLEELDTGELAAWLDSHPGGAVVAYFGKRRVRPQAFLFQQPFRGDTAVIVMSSAQAKSQIMLLLGTDKENRPVSVE